MSAEQVPEEKKVRYEVLIGKHWEKCKKAASQKHGWLHYEMRDGTIGMARPGEWRTV